MLVPRARATERPEKQYTAAQGDEGSPIPVHL